MYVCFHVFVPQAISQFNSTLFDVFKLELCLRSFSFSNVDSEINLVDNLYQSTPVPHPPLALQDTQAYGRYTSEEKLVPL